MRETPRSTARSTERSTASEAAHADAGPTRVAVFPHYDGNPYQRELVAGLRAAGLEVDLLSGRPVETLRGVLRGRPDVVHVHWISPYLVTDSLFVSLLMSTVFLTGVLALRLAGVDVVWTVHNMAEHERRHERLERFVTRRFARRCSAIIVHCGAARDAVRREFLGERDVPVVVVPHGHYLDAYENEVDRDTARAALGFGDDETVFLYLGYVRRYKGVDTLVEAFSRTTDPTNRLVVAGSPHDEAIRTEMLAAAAADDRITTDLRFVPEDEVQTYMNAADVVALPHVDVLTSGSAILAMSFGRALVAPTIGCLPETLAQQAELLHDPEADLTSVLERATRADLAAIGRRNLSAVAAVSWDEIGRRTAAVYRGAEPDAPDGSAADGDDRPPLDGDGPTPESGPPLSTP